MQASMASMSRMQDIIAAHEEQKRLLRSQALAEAAHGKHQGKMMSTREQAMADAAYRNTLGEQILQLFLSLQSSLDGVVHQAAYDIVFHQINSALHSDMLPAEAHLKMVNLLDASGTGIVAEGAFASVYAEAVKASTQSLQPLESAILSAEKTFHAASAAMESSAATAQARPTDTAAEPASTARTATRRESGAGNKRREPSPPMQQVCSLSHPTTFTCPPLIGMLWNAAYQGRQECCRTTIAAAAATAIP